MTTGSGEQQPPLIVGLTGGIGAGKSTVARALAEHGAEVIDMDGLGHLVLEPGGRAYHALIDAFGPEIVADDGTISRPALGGKVFGDPEALARLNAISHPAINAELLDRLQASTSEIVVLDMAILVESQLGRLDPPWGYTTVITVEAPVELRVTRAVERGMDEADARRRVERQASEEDRRAVADRVITNAADEAALRAEVDACWTWLCSLRD
ncbi:MAG: dephospho-CoA kinase [Acidimicrobiales bacterium]